MGSWRVSEACGPVQVATGEVKTIGQDRLYTASSPSPDGRYLLVSWLEPPYSYTVPCGRFPKRVQLWDCNGNFVREIAALPLAEDIPIAFDSCRKGPRGIEWRDDKPAEMAWVECQDGGDPAVEVSPRDKVYVLEADAARDAGCPPRCIAGTDMRCNGVAWGSADLALLYEAEWKTRRSRSWVIAPDQPGVQPEVLFDRMYEDSYTDPGSPMQRRTSMGTYVIAQLDGERKLLLQGACPTHEQHPALCCKRCLQFQPHQWCVCSPACFVPSFLPVSWCVQAAAPPPRATSRFWTYWTWPPVKPAVCGRAAHPSTRRCRPF